MKVNDEANRVEDHVKPIETVNFLHPCFPDFFALFDIFFPLVRAHRTGCNVDIIILFTDQLESVYKVLDRFSSDQLIELVVDSIVDTGVCLAKDDLQLAENLTLILLTEHENKVDVSQLHVVLVLELDNLVLVVLDKSMKIFPATLEVIVKNLSPENVRNVGDSW